MSFTISVKAKPNSRAASFEIQPDGSYLARLQSVPVDGKANAELVELVSEHFRVKKNQVSIKSGAGGRLKLVTIDSGEHVQSIFPAKPAAHPPATRTAKSKSK